MRYIFPVMVSPTMPLRQSASGLLTCLLLILLTGCNSDEPDTQPTLSLKSSTPEQIKAPVEAPKNTDAAPVILPEPMKQVEPPPAKALAVRLIIDVNRATDSVDLTVLQSGGELPVLPLQLSVDLFDAPLRAVLRELARKLDAKVSISDDVPDQPISLQLHGVSVTDGIKQILRETNYLLVYKESPRLNKGAGNVSATEIAEIRVLPKSNTEPMSDKTASLKTLEPTDQTADLEAWKKQVLTAERVEDRLAALKQFLEHADPSEHNELLIAALEDKSPEVRKFALNSMSDGANPLFEPISQTALNDTDPQIRVAALDVLISRYGANAVPVLEQALADPDADVQQSAKSNLEMAQRVKRQVDEMLHRQTK